MGLSAFNLMRMRMKAEEERRKAEAEKALGEKEGVSTPSSPDAPVVKSKKRTDAEKLKSKGSKV